MSERGDLNGLREMETLNFMRAWSIFESGAAGVVAPSLLDLSPDPTVSVSGRRGSDSFRGGRCYDPIRIIAHPSQAFHSRPTAENTRFQARKTWLTREPLTAKPFRPDHEIARSGYSPRAKREAFRMEAESRDISQFEKCGFARMDES